MSWFKSIRVWVMIILIQGISCTGTQNPTVLIITDMGEIAVEIYLEDAPVTASNFLDLVSKGIYTDAEFYRVVRMDNQPQNKVKIEVIQGGLFDDDQIDLHTPIVHESTLNTGIKHTDGIFSMARMEPGTASTEFFICIGDQPDLDFGGARNPDNQGFAAFGKVVRGMEVVIAIQALPDTNQYLEKRAVIRQIVMQQEP